MENLSIIVSSPVLFSQSYESKIEEAREKYVKWALENLGYEPESEHSYVSYESRAYFKFSFESKEDLFAFKMRWL